MKITVLFVSKSGNTEKAAELIKQGIQSTGDIEVKLMNLLSEETVDAQFIQDSSALIVGTPTYMADMAWQLKKWFDTDRSVKLSGKLGAAFATANFVHGGPDIAIYDVLKNMLVKGMVVYSSGSGCGAPIIHLGPVAIANELDKTKELFEIFGKRVAEKATELFDK